MPVLPLLNVCWIDFTAMSTDYYPRLAGVAHDNKRGLY
jgi:hypothetical protein